MARKVDITAELNAIKVTPFGKRMRPNIHDGMEKLARDFNNLGIDFENLIIDAGNNNAEVVLSRTDNTTQPPQTYTILGDRLDAITQTAKDHELVCVHWREFNPVPFQINDPILTDKDEVIINENDIHISHGQ